MTRNGKEVERDSKSFTVKGMHMSCIQELLAYGGLWPCKLMSYYCKQEVVFLIAGIRPKENTSIIVADCMA